MPELRVRVECYSGYRADERPLRFYLGGTCLEVASIEDRWYSPGCTFFRLVVGCGDRYVLKHNEAQETWTLEAFRAAAVSSASLAQK